MLVFISVATYSLFSCKCWVWGCTLLTMSVHGHIAMSPLSCFIRCSMWSEMVEGGDCKKNFFVKHLFFCFFFNLVWHLFSGSGRSEVVFVCFSFFFIVVLVYIVGIGQKIYSFFSHVQDELCYNGYPREKGNVTVIILHDIVIFHHTFINHVHTFLCWQPWQRHNIHHSWIGGVLLFPLSQPRPVRESKRASSISKEDLTLHY